MKINTGILIADSGSTKTDWRFFDGNTVSEIQTIGFNPYYQDTESIANELKINLLPFCESEIHQVFYYGTGVTNDEKAQVIKNALVQVFPTIISIEVQSDVIGAARSLCGNGSGIACILGTGSNSCFFDGEKIAFQIPPLGFWLGDEGSGGHLGKTLVLSYLHKEMPLDLRQKFEERFGVLDRLTILNNAYHQPFPNRYFASFSRFLHDNLTIEFCKNLVEKCFSDFFEKYIQKYPMLAETDVGFVGSVAYFYEDLVREIAKNKKISINKILEKPINGLIDFHCKKL